MKKRWFPAGLAILLLVSCAPDRTLETLVPRNALAVLLVDHPAVLSALAASGTEILPWKALDSGKPWAAAVVPSSPPGFFLALALDSGSGAWPAVQSWARNRGGLVSTRAGAYAILYSPGIPPPGILAPLERFNLARVRAKDDLVSLYVDTQNVLADRGLAAQVGSSRAAWIAGNFDGVRLGLARKDGGLAVRVTTDMKGDSKLKAFFRLWPAPADLSAWTGLLSSEDTIGGVVSLPPQGLLGLGASLPEPLRRRWAAVVPVIGPRAAWTAEKRTDGWTWTVSVESRDPQAVRQALKTLVASGELQQAFSAWSLDPDTPVIYQDKAESGGILTQIVVGSAAATLAYGPSRVTAAGGAGALESLRNWQRDPVAAQPWFAQAPSGAALIAQGSMDGLGARGSLRVQRDGNLEALLWVDGAGLEAWVQRVPQLIRGGLSGKGSGFRLEP